MPAFPHMRENNVRKGFLEDEQFHAMMVDAELWFRGLVECGRTYGWRVSELLGLKVEQIDLTQKVIRLEPGTTKNNDGREVFMTDTVRALLSACVQSKTPDAHVFARANGSPVRDFRVTWERACPKCKSQRSVYSGLIFHDLRRTVARNLRRAGIPETVIMKIGGWRTRSVFERYAIVSRTDIADAMRKLQQSEEATQIQQSHEMVTAAVPATQTLQ
jgi:integrase